MVKVREGKRQCRRTNSRDAVANFIPGKRRNGFSCPVAEVLSETTVKMQIDEARNEEGLRPLKRFFLTQFLPELYSRKATVLYRYRTEVKLLILRKNLTLLHAFSLPAFSENEQMRQESRIDFPSLPHPPGYAQK